MRERIKWVDWAKTICMYFVILGHCHLCESSRIITTLIYTFHMPLFFFLSGLLCSKPNWDVKSFIKDIKYLLIPYLTYGIISIIIDCTLSHNLTIDVIITKLNELIVGYDCSIGPIWFLPALFFCKQIFLFMRHYDHKNQTKVFLQIISLLPIYFFFNHNINLPFFIDSGICAFPFFYFGHYSSKIVNYIKGLSPSSKVLLFLLLLCSLIPLGWYNGSVVIADCIYGQHLLLYYLNALIGIILVLQICISIENRLNQIVYIFAYGSIITLGFHGYILRFLHYYIPIALGYYKPTYSLLTAFFYSVIVYAICFVLIIVIDRFKVSNIFGLKGRVIENSIKQNIQ